MADGGLVAGADVERNIGAQVADVGGRVGGFQGGTGITVGRAFHGRGVCWGLCVLVHSVRQRGGRDAVCQQPMRGAGGLLLGGQGACATLYINPGAGNLPSAKNTTTI